MSANSLSEILSDFGNEKPYQSVPEYIGIRVTREMKERYDKLQAKSRKQFGRKVKEALLAMIEIAEGKT